MKKPNELVLWIYDNSPIIEVGWVDENQEDDFCTRMLRLTGRRYAQVVSPHSEFAAVATLRLTSQSVCQLTNEALAEARAYREWEKTNAKDLAEFKRLAEKLGIAV